MRIVGYLALVNSFINHLGYGSATFDTKKPAVKTWWANYITDEVYASGRPTLTEIKYASEAGFKSIISLFNFTSEGSIGEEVIPTSENAKNIAVSLGLQYGVVIPDGFDWTNKESLDSYSQLVESLPKPILFHCFIGYSSSFLALLHQATSQNANPRLSAEDVFRRGAQLGFNYSLPDFLLIDFTKNITKEQSFPITIPEVELFKWEFAHSRMKFVHSRWFIAGQIQTNHLDTLYQAGIRTVINVRQAKTTDNQPSQEEVALLNIRDNTGTYTGTGRQTTDQLTKNILDINKPTEYISSSSPVNYQSMNPLQFGDDVGYNEELERQAVIQANLTYIHMPIVKSRSLTKGEFEDFRRVLLADLPQGGVVVHSQTGVRAVILALLNVGIEESKDYQWAQKKAAEIGYNFDQQNDAQVLNLFRDVLPGSSSAGRLLTSTTALIIWALLMVATLLAISVDFSLI